MTTKRYYYADPLKAAWMAREFGVRFRKHLKIKIDADFYSDGEVQYSVLHDCYNIHPDDYGVFEPKLDDIIRLSAYFGDYEYTTTKDAKYMIFLKERIKEGDYVCDIILRNGKAFFMPEVEEINA